MAVSAVYSAGLSVTETPDVNAGGLASGQTILYNAYNVGVTLNAGSSPAASLHANFVKTLSSGTGTIDLTALSGTNGATINGNGLKVRMLRVQAPATNANNITVTFGAANPYALFGATFVLTVYPGMDLISYLADKAPVIGSGAKNLDLAGTGSQVLNFEIVIG